MGEVISFDKLHKGADLILVTAAGIITGKYVGIEYINDTPWIELSDGFIGTVKSSMALSDTLPFPQTIVQVNQIIAINSGFSEMKPHNTV